MSHPLGVLSHERSGEAFRGTLRTGPEGVRARFFRQAQGCIATEFIRDFNEQRRYPTLDFWTSREAYGRSRIANANEYHAIDQHCEALTEQEKELGRFERL